MPGTKVTKKEKERLMGQIVRVTHKLIRVTSSSGISPKGKQLVHAFWKKQKLPKPKTGWIVGFRNKPSGFIKHSRGDKYCKWIPITGTGYLAVMIVFQPLHNPIPCPLDEVNSPLLYSMRMRGD